MSEKPLFALGQIVATPGALSALTLAGLPPAGFLRRHVTGDWGDLSHSDKKLNDASVKDGSRIFSAYTLSNSNVKIWVITESDRSVTTILLPEEY